MNTQSSASCAILTTPEYHDRFARLFMAPAAQAAPAPLRPIPSRHS
ncbi:MULTISPECIES: hypothetical protein [unclassified Streptomyces]|nr:MULTISPECIES: hypothetical protein [unclassified Streptomyces]MDF3144116.1 hypothetical protein [Streptomyces sp. T21Q-yed]WDF35781.1 hypothetical protein PBV52_02710 [Streptomyces sp. T12]